MKNSKKLLNVKELGEVLNVSEGTIYYWVSRDEVPFIRIGKHIRFSIDIIIHHWSSQQEKTTLKKMDADLYIKSLGSFTTEERQEVDEKNGAKNSHLKK